MTVTPQRDHAWLTSATPQQITAAFDAGELNELLGRPVPAAVDGQATEEQLAAMTPEQKAAALQAGQLDAILGRAQKDA